MAWFKVFESPDTVTEQTLHLIKVCEPERVTFVKPKNGGPF